MARGAGSRKQRTSSRRTMQSRAVQRVTPESPVALAVAEPSAERGLLESMREALAMKGECSDCGHMAIKHLGAENAGPCTAEGCDCDGMVQDDDSDTEVAATTVAYVTISEDAQQAAIAAMLEGVQVSAEGVNSTDFLQKFHFRFGEFVTSLQDEFDAIVLPDELQPGETVPVRTPSPAAPEPQPVATLGGVVKWRASMVPEATLTDDGRAFAPDSITWRELPLTLMAMIETTAGGHEGALVSGRIDRIWRDANGMIWGEGIFDEGDYGMDIARMVGDGTLRGISVDVAVANYEVGPRSNWFDDDGNWAPSTEEAAEESSLADLLFGGEDEKQVIFVVTEGVIGAATVCPFQAFADAKIELTASLIASASPALWTVTSQAGWIVTQHPKTEATGVPVEGVEVPAGEEGVLTAAAAGLVPLAPPAEWFENPSLTELTPLVVTADGRIYGHAAAWDTCHISIPDVCTVAPHSNAEYAYFHLKEVECADGESVSCGTITLETGHADRTLKRAQAAAHYDNTGLAAADVKAGEDEFGIWVAGALRSDMDATKVRELRGAVLSGDWRNVNGQLELVALLAVNVPGFPIPRTRALVAAGDDGNHVMTLVAAGVHNGPVEGGTFVSPEAQAKFDAFRAIADGRFAALAARARNA